MGDIVRALGRALRSIMRRDIFWHLLWPGVAATVVWIGIAVAAWSPLIDALMGWIEGLTWVGGWISASELTAAVVLVLLKIAVALAFVPLIYVSAAIIVAVVALPMMLERVAVRDYADLERRHGGSNLGSVWNALGATALFMLALLLSLPFWLIPGVGLVVSVLLTGWLNQRAFGYDALMLHADRAELADLPRRERMGMLALGGSTAMLAYVPVVNFIAPAFAGLAFVHYMLEALRRERVARGVTLLDPAPAAANLPRVL